MICDAVIDEVVDLVRRFKRPVDEIDVSLALCISQRAAMMALMVAAVDQRLVLTTNRFWYYPEHGDGHE